MDTCHGFPGQDGWSKFWTSKCWKSPRRLEKTRHSSIGRKFTVEWKRTVQKKWRGHAFELVAFEMYLVTFFLFQYLHEMLSQRHVNIYDNVHFTIIFITKYTLWPSLLMSNRLVNCVKWAKYPIKLTFSFNFKNFHGKISSGKYPRENLPKERA